MRPTRKQIRPGAARGHWREYAQAQRAPFAAYRKATTDDERKKAVASRPDAKKYVARMMELAESAPDDPAAVDALLWVVNHGGQTREVDRAIERLARDHAQDPKIMQIGSTPANSISPAGERLLRAIAEKSPDRAVQKRAAFALARLLNNEAELCPPDEAEQERTRSLGHDSSRTGAHRGSPGERP